MIDHIMVMGHAMSHDHDMIINGDNARLLVILNSLILSYQLGYAYYGR